VVFFTFSKAALPNMGVFDLKLTQGKNPVWLEVNPHRIFSICINKSSDRFLSLPKKVRAIAND